MKIRTILAIISILILSSALMNCQIQRNPDDPDMDNPDYEIKYYSYMTVNDPERYFYFSSDDLIPDYETASEKIRFYEVFYHKGTDKIYKVKLFFEKVAGTYPRLYSWFKPQYNEAGQIIENSTYRRYGAEDLLFILAYSVNIDWAENGLIEKISYYDHFPLFNDEISALIDGMEQGQDIKPEDTRLAMEIFYFRGLEQERKIYYSDGRLKVIEYSYNSSREKTKFSFYSFESDFVKEHTDESGQFTVSDAEKEDNLVYYWNCEDGFGTELVKLKGEMEWMLPEIDIEE